MSIKIMSEVWENAPLVGTDLLVLLALADMANDENRECWPGLKNLSHKARISTRQVSSVLGDLELQGIICITSRLTEKGGNTSNLYRISEVANWGVLKSYMEDNAPTNHSSSPMEPQFIPPVSVAPVDLHTNRNGKPKGINASQSPQPSNTSTVQGNPPVVTKKRSEKSPKTINGWLDRLPPVRAVVVEMLTVCYEGWDAIMMTPENCLTVHQLENYILNSEEYVRLGGDSASVGQVYEFVADQVDYTIAPKTLAGYLLRWKASQSQSVEPTPAAKQVDEPKRELSESERTERLAKMKADRASIFGEVA